MASVLSRGLPSAGLYAGPAAWMVDTQANYALVPWICAHQAPLVPIVALVLAAVSLFGGFLSWQAWRVAPAVTEREQTGGGRPHHFLALVGTAMAVLFAAVILLHGAAGLVFHGCER